jgi:hypothetical protein
MSCNLERRYGTIEQPARVRVDAEPWLLGFCRWAVEETYATGDTVWRVTVASGRWRWRGRRAEYIETRVA